MFTKRFWAGLAERAIRAAAWADLALVGNNASGLVGKVHFAAFGMAAGIAAFFSVITSLAGSQVGDKDTPSLLPADKTP